MRFTLAYFWILYFFIFHAYNDVSLHLCLCLWSWLLDAPRLKLLKSCVFLICNNECNVNVFTVQGALSLLPKKVTTLFSVMYSAHNWQRVAWLQCHHLETKSVQSEIQKDESPPPLVIQWVCVCGWVCVGGCLRPTLKITQQFNTFIVRRLMA